MRAVLALLLVCALLPAASAQCSPGYFYNSTASCVACSAGYSNVFGNGTVCTACVPGMFASSTGASSCSPCPAGTSSAAFGSSTCTNCTAGQTSAGQLTSGGLLGYYYTLQRADTSGTATTTQVDASINFAWTAAPAPGVSSSIFSAQ